MSTASTWLARSRSAPAYFPTARKPGPRVPGLFARIEQAIGEHRRRKAERLVAGFIERNGGRVTDSVEREIGNRALRG